MAHLSIRNIGPVKTIDIELNRINIFMGPQSSGKSTVAKIVSFCQWLEKDCLLHQTVGHVDNAYIKTHLFDYFAMTSCHGKENAMFHYVGNGIEISYMNNAVTVNKTSGFQTMQVSKNLYLPSERNVLGIPGIFTTKMPNCYLLDFLDDWQIIRTKYSLDTRRHLLDLKESYFYDSKSNADMLLLDDGDSIPFSEGSSGIQSVTPLCVFIDYITEWIYSHDEDKSAYSRRKYRQAAISRYFMGKSETFVRMLDDIYRKKSPESERISQQLADLVDTLNRIQENKSDILPVEDPDTKNLIDELTELEHGISRPSLSNLVVEEPEQNLFPDTQVKLLYFILSKVNYLRDSLIITTHSPYILYAINNCMLASKVSEEDIDEVAQAIDIPKDAWVDSNKVSVWELDNGIIKGGKTIQDERGLIRGNYFDRVMHNVMADFHTLVDYSE